MMKNNPYDWMRLYDEFHDRCRVWDKKPVIGITGNFGD